MEKRVSSKVNEFFLKFKDDVKEFIVKNNDNTEQFNGLLKYIYEYEKLNLEKEDFTKRKRVKNTVPHYERCCAKRANNEQCTRRRKDGEMFCGTHIKGTPNGIISKDAEQKPTKKIVEVSVQDIKGIVYYIDQDKNVYNTEDVVANKENPRVIAKWHQDEEGNYSIPEFDKMLEGN